MSSDHGVRLTDDLHLVSVKGGHFDSIIELKNEHVLRITVHRLREQLCAL